jgi:hypothetical protein
MPSTITMEATKEVGNKHMLMKSSAGACKVHNSTMQIRSKINSLHSSLFVCVLIRLFNRWDPKATYHFLLKRLKNRYRK